MKVHILLLEAWREINATCLFKINLCSFVLFVIGLHSQWWVYEGFRGFHWNHLVPDHTLFVTFLWSQQQSNSYSDFHYKCWFFVCVCTCACMCVCVCVCIKEENPPYTYISLGSVMDNWFNACYMYNICVLYYTIIYSGKSWNNCVGVICECTLYG